MQRGIYAKKDLKKRKLILNKNVYFAFPIKKGQLTSNQLKGDIVSKISVNKDQPLKSNKVLIDKNLSMIIKLARMFIKQKLY